MLIAGAINFVVFIERRNDYQLRRPACAGSWPACARSTASTAGSLSSEIWAPGPDGRARPAAPIQAIEDLEAAGYRPDDYGRWSG